MCALLKIILPDRDHVERAIAVMTKLLPSGNLMLCSANRVKALILEEQALDNFHNYSESDGTLIFHIECNVLTRAET